MRDLLKVCVVSSLSQVCGCKVKAMAAGAETGSKTELFLESALSSRVRLKKKKKKCDECAVETLDIMRMNSHLFNYR